MCKYFALSLMVLFVFISFVKADLSDGLVLYLPFDEGEGKVVHDLSQNQFTGKIKGNPKWVEGKFGSALSFGGLTDYVEVPYDDVFDIREAITIHAWIMADFPMPDPQWHTIINACAHGQGPWGAMAYRSNGATIFNPYYYVVGEILHGGSRSLSPNVFLQVCSTYDQDDGLCVYLNGVLDRKQPGGKGLLHSTVSFVVWNDPVSIASYGSADRRWIGVIDEVMVYNRVLSADEVAELFEAPPPSGKAVFSSGKLATAWGKVKRGR